MSSWGAEEPSNNLVSLHHFALEIDKDDFDVHDPEGNILELVCYDEAIE